MAAWQHMVERQGVVPWEQNWRSEPVAEEHLPMAAQAHGLTVSAPLHPLSSPSAVVVAIPATVVSAVIVTVTAPAAAATGVLPRPALEALRLRCEDVRAALGALPVARPNLWAALATASKAAAAA
eukprot:CAMPEP_0197874162 /NCGR_PEP_ID=MMETSP1439-20131203/3769_1 /TAXON_ID=66791 /ORGANISM="Gonyaulax spinifera, Strain CCMP409" /LENGTH=124 /DNA_ID=CAMNT_0043493257 /DNA_START=55 /DNA_END=424 /DNA_ORIENTATION=+